MANQGGGQRGLRQITGIVVTLGLVAGATAGILRGLDAVATYLQGDQRGVKRYRSVEDVERKVGMRLLLPAYFPDSLQWPPAAVRLSSAPPQAVALSFTGREAGAERLVIVQTLGPPASLPPELVPAARTLHATPIRLDDVEATLSRITGAGGEIWHEIVFERAGRQVVLRFAGPVEELLAMARSMRGRGP